MKDYLNGDPKKIYSRYADKRQIGPDGINYAVVEVWNGENDVFVCSVFGGCSVLAAALIVERINEVQS